jgi:lipid A ethanolaminephosphotransferase
MFSVYGRANYSASKIRSTESLLDVLKHAGISAMWWDNNTGSKGVADRVEYVPLMDTRDRVICPGNECRDEIFLERLDRQLTETRDDTVIVLHQIGSHGPAYYRRYSDAQRLFTPDCRTTDLPKCSPDEVRNAYDNSIVATDAFLASVIRLLEKHGAALNTAMLYVSDHGESLGENGLFLHGAPYAFAPREQTHVPMVAWFSDNYRAAFGLDRACLAQRAANAYSHDNWFHTTLGLFDVRTSVYKPDLDMFRPCRAKG